ncbi:MAG: hypothetical protein JKX85_03310 [Phycisphaeraceae bacterium]|nr:hypothetical protein [Phycisphaeraceae bacterium]
MNQPHPPINNKVIKHHCLHCSGGLEFDSGLAGKQAHCPACGQITNVPQQSIPRIFKVLILVSICAMTILFLFLTLGDKSDRWELYNSSEFKGLCNKTILLIKKGKNQEGLVKYDELLNLLKDRQLKDLELRAYMDETLKAVESAKKQLDEKARQEKFVRETPIRIKNFNKLSSLELRASRLIETGKLLEGIGSYRAAIVILNSINTDTIRLQRISKRILSAHKVAEFQLAKSEQIQKRKHLLEEKQQEILRRKQEEQKRLRLLRIKQFQEAPILHFTLFKDFFVTIYNKTLENHNFSSYEVSYDLIKSNSLLHPLRGIITFKTTHRESQKVGWWEDYSLEFVPTENGEWRLEKYLCGDRMFGQDGRWNTTSGDKANILFAIIHANAKLFNDGR